MLKNTFLFLLSITIGILLFYLYKTLLTNPQTTTLQKPIPAKSQFSLDKAPSEALSAAITSLSGTTNWQSRTATQSSQLLKTQKIQQGETIATQDNGKITLKFSDPITITAFPNTQLNLIQTIPTNIVLSQQNGNATYTNTGNTPLAIRINNLLIEFTNATIATSINNEITTISVSKGTIKAAYNNSENISKTLSIKTNQKFTFNNNSKEISIE